MSINILQGHFYPMEDYVIMWDIPSLVFLMCFLVVPIKGSCVDYC